MGWTWVRVRNRSQARQYVETLQCDAIVDGRTDYPRVGVSEVVRMANAPELGRFYWLGQNDVGDFACFMVRALPKDQGESVIVENGKRRIEPAARRNEPRILEIGAMPKTRGKTAWVRAFRKAFQLVLNQMTVIAPELRAASCWRGRRFHAADVDKVRGRLYARAMAALEGAVDEADEADARHRFAFEVGDADG